MDNGREDKLPWTKWYWSDWVADTGLRLCGLAAKGLWMEMLAIMSRSKTKGALLLNNKSLLIDDLARIAGADPDVVKTLIGELEDHEVFSRLDDGTIINRRMYKEHELSSVRSEAGKHGAIKRWGLTEEDQERLKEGRERKEKLGFPIYSLIASQRRVAAKNKGTHTDTQWQNLKQAFDVSCPSCGKKEPEISLTKDHIIPISLGGSDHISNIQPLCQSCNSSKGREKTKWQNIAKQNGKKRNDDIAASASASEYASTSSSEEGGVGGKPKFEARHIELAQFLETKIAENVPYHKFTGSNYLESWAREFRLMEDRDKIPFQDIKSILERSLEDEFWRINILSAGTFREKFGRLAAKVSGNNRRVPDPPQVGANIGTEKSPAYWAEVRRLKAEGLEGQALTDTLKNKSKEGKL